MKAIHAYFKASREERVKAILQKIDGLTGVTFFDVRQGYGRIRGEDQPMRINDDAEIFVPHVKLELFCHDDLVDQVVEAIANGAHTGLREDGKIYILPVDDAIRISTGDRGEGAV